MALQQPRPWSSDSVTHWIATSCFIAAPAHWSITHAHPPRTGLYLDRLNNSTISWLGWHQDNIWDNIWPYEPGRADDPSLQGIWFTSRIVSVVGIYPFIGRSESNKYNRVIPAKTGCPDSTGLSYNMTSLICAVSPEVAWWLWWWWWVDDVIGAFSSSPHPLTPWVWPPGSLHVSSY